MSKERSEADRRARQSQRIGRALRLLCLIQERHGRWDLPSLARELGCSTKTIQRDLLALEEAVPGSTIIDWLGTGFETSPSAIDREPPRFLDREFEGINFLPPADRDRLQPSLNEFWPTTGSLPNWDAVGQIKVGCEDA